MAGTWGRRWDPDDAHSSCNAARRLTIPPWIATLVRERPHATGSISERKFRNQFAWPVRTTTRSRNTEHDNPVEARSDPGQPRSPRVCANLRAFATLCGSLHASIFPLAAKSEDCRWSGTTKVRRRWIARQNCPFPPSGSSRPRPIADAQAWHFAARALGPRSEPAGLTPLAERISLVGLETVSV